jgi:hypothetical protein
MMTSELIKVSTRLGFKGATSYQKIYKGGTFNVFGNPQNSVSYFTIHLTKDSSSIVRIKTNTTYFKPTKQIDLINSNASFKKPLLLTNALSLLSAHKN